MKPIVRAKLLNHTKNTCRKLVTCTLSNINILRSLCSTCTIFSTGGKLDFYVVTRSYSSRPFLCALDTYLYMTSETHKNYALDILVVGYKILDTWFTSTSSNLSRHYQGVLLCFTFSDRVIKWGHIYVHVYGMCSQTLREYTNPQTCQLSQMIIVFKHKGQSSREEHVTRFVMHSAKVPLVRTLAHILLWWCSENDQHNSWYVPSLCTCVIFSWQKKSSILFKQLHAAGQRWNKYGGEVGGGGGITSTLKQGDS